MSVKTFWPGVDALSYLCRLDGYAYFAPSIIRSLGHSPIGTQLYSVPPWIASFGLGMAIATFSDWFRMRYIFIIIPSAVGLVGYAMLISIHNNVNAMYAALFLAVSGNFAAMPVIICWFNSNCECFSIHSRDRRLTAKNGLFN